MRRPDRQRVEAPAGVPDDSNDWCDDRLIAMVTAFVGEFPGAGVALGPTLEAWGWDTRRTGAQRPA